MRTVLALALASAILPGAPTGAASLPEHHPLPLLRPANDVVGTWEFQVRLFNCDTGQPLREFRAMSLFNAGGTMLDTNNAPTSTRGPGFGSWTYDPRRRSYSAQMRLYRYNPDGSFAGVNQVHRTLWLSADGDQVSGEFRGEIRGPDEQVLARSCGYEDGVRSL